MGLTYTSADQRARRRARVDLTVSTGEWLLLATTVVAMVAIGVTYLGRLRAMDWVDRGAPVASAAPVNVNVVTTAAELELPLSSVFSNAADRRLAAQAMYDFLAPGGKHVRIPNVGSLMSIRVPATAVDGDARFVALPTRLDAARASALAAGRPGPIDLTLFTPAELAAVKPLLSVRTRGEFGRAVLWSAVAVLAGFHLVSLAWRLRARRGDRVLLAAVHLLTTVGVVAILSRPDPLRDTLLVSRFSVGIAIGLGVLTLVSFARLRTASFLQLSFVPLLAAVVLSFALLVFGSGPGTSGAKVNLGPVQPIEGIRLLLALFLAGYFARRWELLRQVRAETVRDRPLPRWLNLPRLDHVLPVVAGVAIALALFFLQRDLGPALLLSLTFLGMYAVARRGVGGVALGLTLLVAGFYVGLRLHISSTLTARIGMWQSAWDNAVRGGDQTAQAIWALAAGAISGTGLGLGHPRFVPEGHTDLVIAAVGEELGLAGLLVITLCYVVIAWRGLRIAREADGDYPFFLSLAMTLSVVVPVLVMAAGVLGLLPLTGVVTPFLSFGGSAMVANFAAIGVLVAVRQARDRTAPVATTEPFRVPLRWLGATMAAATVVVVVMLARVQGLSADELLVRPQLSMQADGGRRFQYNPRILDALRAIPRGTVFDRRNVPMATDRQTIAQEAAASFERMGVLVGSACADPAARCYPLGGPAFHLLGDATTRANWTASNSSYVERDAEDLLRGFSDRTTVVKVVDREGRASSAVRRDFRDVVPIVRRRWQLDHPAVAAILSRSRDVHLTIDARLQIEVARLVGRAARASEIGRAAAVVLDAATGEVLASVSYPWPGIEPASVTPTVDLRNGDGRATDALLDRARYGLYPPGSTFKLVTAAAALRQQAALGETSFTCARLTGSRVGARLPGWSRPIRDDVKDTRPHGRIGLREAIVQSCNAYFAQLAVHLGPDALSGTAVAAGIAVTAPRGRLRDTLPHAGYGQGDVLASPLRMARIAAAIGADGTIRETGIVQGGPPAHETFFLSPQSAQRLASALREAVVSGTGRLLRDHPARIAGKTGTAEVDDAESHAWFVGFAPHGAATRRISFAVVIENAGYGGGSAAALAGQIVSAASTTGWIR